jgi:hypothetical protein
LNLGIALECRQYDDARFGKLRPDCQQDLNAIQIRQTEVYEGNVRLQGAEGFDCFSAFAGHPCQRHVGLTIEDCADSLPKQRVVVDTQDSDVSSVSHIWSLMRMPNLELGLQRSIAA